MERRLLLDAVLTTTILPENPSAVPGGTVSIDAFFRNEGDMPDSNVFTGLSFDVGAFPHLSILSSTGLECGAFGDFISCDHSLPTLGAGGEHSAQVILSVAQDAPSGTVPISAFAPGSQGFGDDMTILSIIGSANADPVANDDDDSTNEDTILNIPAPGLLENDTDPDIGDMLTVTDFDSTSSLGASVSIDQNGGHAYDPTVSSALQSLAEGDPISDTFTYTITDSNGGTGTTVASIEITGINDGPINTVPGPQMLFNTDTLSFTGNEFQVVDVDASSLEVMLTVAQGSLSITSTSGLQVSGNTTNSLTAIGSVSNLNNGLGSLVYDPTDTFIGSDTLAMASEMGHSSIPTPCRSRCPRPKSPLRPRTSSTSKKIPPPPCPLTRASF